MLHVGGDLAHGRVVGDPFAAAHHDPQTVVAFGLVSERREVVPRVGEKSNPKLLDIFIFSAGEVLSIPDVTVEEESDKPAWR